MNTDRNMNDQNLHENLSRVGASLTLPEEPTPQQRERWTTPSATAQASAPVVTRSRRRLFTMIGAGSALAACIALAVTLSDFGGSKRVEAAAIFASLRDAMSRAFSLHITNIRQDGIQANGRLCVVMPGTANPQTDGSDEPAQIYLDLHVEADDGVEDIGGLNADISLAAEEGNEWIYLRMSELPDDIANEPFAALFAGMTANGLVLDVTGLLLDHEVHPLAIVAEEPAGDSADTNTEPGRMLNLGFSVGTSDEPAPESTAHHHGTHLKLFAMHGAHHGESAEGTGETTTNSPPAGESESQTPPNGHDFRDVENFLRGLFEGNLTGEELAAMVSHLEQAAQDVQINDLGGGNFSLIAGNFNHPGNGLDADEQAMLERLVVEIRYSENTGVDWLELRNVGEADGTIRFEQLPGGIDPALLDRTRFTAAGNIPVIPVATLMQMFHGHLQSQTQGNEASSQPRP